MQTTTFDWPSTAFMLRDLDVPIGPVTQSFEASHGHDFKWSGSRSWNDALHMAKHGINRNLAEFANDDARLGRGLAPRRVHDVMGLTADIGRIAVGAPDSMVARTRKESPLFIRALIHVGANFHVNADTLERRGINVLRVIRALEETGNRVSVTVCTYSETLSGTDALLCMANLKTFGALTDAQEVAFYLSHVAAFRWIFFRAIMLHATDARLHSVWACLGRSMDVPQEQRKDVDLYVPIAKSTDDVLEPAAMVAQAINTARARRAVTL